MGPIGKGPRGRVEPRDELSRTQSLPSLRTIRPTRMQIYFLMEFFSPRLDFCTEVQASAHGGALRCRFHGNSLSKCSLS